MIEAIPLALTPEQLAALAAGQAVVHAQDPQTKRRYTLIDEEPQRLTVDELRAMLQEAVDESDRGECRPWDVEEVKEELRRRLASRQNTP